MLMAKYIHNLFNNPDCIAAIGELIPRCLTYIYKQKTLLPEKKNGKWKVLSETSAQTKTFHSLGINFCLQNSSEQM